jgi:hypothetical protein
VRFLHVFLSRSPWVPPSSVATIILPAVDQDSKEWRTATEILIGTAEGRDFLMHARIGMMRALYRNLPPPEPRRKRAKAYRIVK